MRNAVVQFPRSLLYGIVVDFESRVESTDWNTNVRLQRCLLIVSMNRTCAIAGIIDGQQHEMRRAVDHEII
jgi:hypothetical protein